MYRMLVWSKTLESSSVLLQLVRLKRVSSRMNMSGLESDTIGGFNAMIEKQKKEDGEAYVSTVLFDNESTVLHDRLPLGKIPKMTARDYSVRGYTACKCQ